MGVPPISGHLHPLLKVRSEFRDIFFQMGFSEMPTNMFVESSFWNFDALFQPQQYPFRDAYDTFFIKDPATSRPSQRITWNASKRCIRGVGTGALATSMIG